MRAIEGEDVCVMHGLCGRVVLEVWKGNVLLAQPGLRPAVARELARALLEQADSIAPMDEIHYSASDPSKGIQ